MAESPKQRGTAEPTNTELLEFMQIQFDRVDGQLGSLAEGLTNVQERLGDVHHRVVNLEHGLSDVQETLGGTLRAVDKDAASIIDHERRITRLERAKV